MILCVSVDGVDGAGKTTLIDSLGEKYNVVTLPRFYCTGIVPQNRDERKCWFQTQDVLFTTKIYISGYKLRIFSAREFKRGLHYKFSTASANNLVVMDRGFLSLKAYSFAMLRKTGNFSSEAADKKIAELSGGELEELAEETIDLSILLFEDSRACLDKILARRVVDDNERRLVTYQHEYYSLHAKELNRSKILPLSPLTPPEKIFKTVVEKIEELEKCIGIATTC